MFRRLFSGLADLFGRLAGRGGVSEPPLPPPPAPPAPEEGEEEEEVPEEKGELDLDDWPKDEEGNRILLWDTGKRIDRSEWHESDRGWSGVRRAHATHSEAVNYARRVPVPCMIVRDEDDFWRVIIVYP